MTITMQAQVIFSIILSSLALTSGSPRFSQNGNSIQRIEGEEHIHLNDELSSLTLTSGSPRFSQKVNSIQRIRGEGYIQLNEQHTCTVSAKKILPFDNTNWLTVDIKNEWTFLLSNMVETNPKDLAQGFAVFIRKNALTDEKIDFEFFLGSEEFASNIQVLIMLEPKIAANTNFKVIVNSKDVLVDNNHNITVGNEKYVQIYTDSNNEEIQITVGEDLNITYNGYEVSLKVSNDVFQQHLEGLCKDETSIYPNIALNRKLKEYLRTIPKLEQNKYEIPGHNRCTEFKTRYFDQNEVICFSIKPLPVCNRKCQPIDLVNKNIGVHCIQQNKVTDLWKTQIDNGGNPDFSHKEESKTISLEIPRFCS